MQPKFRYTVRYIPQFYLILSQMNDVLDLLITVR
jgi:hypothetical protein